MTRARRSFGSLLLVLSLGSATAVRAQQDPPGCVVSGAALFFQTYLADGVTPFIGPVSPCASINLQVTI